MRNTGAVLRAILCTALWSCASGTTQSVSTASARTSGSGAAIDAITEADITRDLYALGGDQFRGREGGTLDELRASVWLADRMREAGLEPAGEDGTYYQWLPMRRFRQSDDGRITIGGTTLRMVSDAATLGPVDISVDAPLVFVELNGNADESMIRGKVVATQLVASAANQPAGRPGDFPRPFNPGGAARQAATRFLQMGAAAVFVVADSAADVNFARVTDALPRGRYGVDTATATSYWPDPRSGPRRPPGQPIVLVRSQHAALFRAPNQRLRAELPTENFQYPSVNMVGRVRGTDARLRDEYVLYSSHQDHDGVRTAVNGDSIWNGADDNATGSVAILAIARAFAKQPGRRSALFVWHGSEERGLIGSRYHVMHPTVPRDKIVAVLNAEMMGRNDPDSMTILGVVPPHRNSTVLVETARRANDEVSKFKLDTLWDMASHPQGWYFRSDHLPYARVGIPALSFSSNLHPDYHTPRDEPSTINYKKLTRVSKWMYATGWAVANADQRPALDPGFKLER